MAWLRCWGGIVVQHGCHRFVGERYAELVARTKLIAGAHLKAAWDNPPVSEDEEMHAPRSRLRRPRHV